MKKLLLVLTLVLAAGAVMAERPVGLNAGEPRRNSIAMTGGVTLDAIEVRLAPYIYAEYARNIQGNLWVGGRLTEEYSVFVAEPLLGGERTADYWVTTGYGIAYWEFPVFRRWLSFRVGGGLGLGLHYDSSMNRTALGSYFMVNAQWVIHISRGFGLTLAPLIAGPWAVSQFELGLWMPEGFQDSPAAAGKIDLWGHIGLYVRF